MPNSHNYPQLNCLFNTLLRLFKTKEISLHKGEHVCLMVSSTFLSIAISYTSHWTKKGKRQQIIMFWKRCSSFHLRKTSRKDVFPVVQIRVGVTNDHLSCNGLIRYHTHRVCWKSNVSLVFIILVENPCFLQNVCAHMWVCVWVSFYLMSYNYSYGKLLMDYSCYYV